MSSSLELLKTYEQLVLVLDVNRNDRMLFRCCCSVCGSREKREEGEGKKKEEKVRLDEKTRASSNSVVWRIKYKKYKIEEEQIIPNKKSK